MRSMFALGAGLLVALAADGARGQAAPPVVEWDAAGGCGLPADLLDRVAQAIGRPRAALSGRLLRLRVTWYPALQTCGSYNTTADLTDEVSKLAALRAQYNVGEVRLHTVFLSSRYTLDPTMQKLYCGGSKTDSETLLKGLAQVGLGTYVEVADGTKISFTGYDLSPLP